MGFVLSGTVLDGRQSATQLIETTSILGLQLFRQQQERIITRIE